MTWHRLDVMNDLGSGRIQSGLVRLVERHGYNRKGGKT